MAWNLTERTGWKQWLTPRSARNSAVHRWYLFPHSFSAELVFSLADEWRLTGKDTILDPFVGAGTTLRAAKDKGVSATGYDLSPLAVMASNIKVAAFSPNQLDKRWQALQHASRSHDRLCLKRTYPDLVQKALPDGRLEALDKIARHIDEIDGSPAERDFFRLALLAVMPLFSQAVATGGWLRWVNQGAGAERIWDGYRAQVELMLSDVRATSSSSTGMWEAEVADARRIPATDEKFSAVITSPPYPNRHDYTRVFGIELMFAFQDWEANRALRYQSFHSHPEARPKRPSTKGYETPELLTRTIRALGDPRIQQMLCGYFLDLYLCLGEMKRVCRTGGHVALVVGNARYDGTLILVDELTAEIGEQTGLRCKEIRMVRLRGNSAQQMGQHGRVASRESIVIFEKRARQDSRSG